MTKIDEQGGTVELRTAMMSHLSDAQETSDDQTRRTKIDLVKLLIQENVDRKEIETEKLDAAYTAVKDGDLRGARKALEESGQENSKPMDGRRMFESFEEFANEEVTRENVEWSRKAHGNLKKNATPEGYSSVREVMDRALAKASESAQKDAGTEVDKVEVQDLIYEPGDSKGEIELRVQFFLANGEPVRLEKGMTDRMEQIEGIEAANLNQGDETMAAIYVTVKSDAISSIVV